jgi:hypothetical protein
LLPFWWDVGQRPDKSFDQRSVIRLSAGAGLGLFDEAHINHTLENRFWAFGIASATVMVKASRGLPRLEQCSILVISMPSSKAAIGYSLSHPLDSPTRDRCVQSWVQGGGSLLLIADHMPLAGVASKLASAFGVEFNDGFAVAGFEDEKSRDAAFGIPTIFSIDTRTLLSHPITEGRTEKESVTSIRSFTGQAFQAPESAQPLMVLPEDFVLLMPEEAWEFTPDTKTIPVGGWLQGAVMPFGSGRAAFFGEAAMFSAQLSDNSPMGMNAPMAEQNFQFVLNVMHWLSGILN